MTFYYMMARPERREERLAEIFARNMQTCVLMEKVGNKTIKQEESEFGRERALTKFDITYKDIKGNK